MDDLLEVAKVLQEWPSIVPEPSLVTDSLASRTLKALRDLHEERWAVGSADIAGLIRSVLRTASATRGVPFTLLLPRTPPFPDQDEWKRHGVDVKAGKPGQWSARAEPWCPPAFGGGCPAANAFLRENRGSDVDNLVAADPVAREFSGYPDYRSPGQAMAVRAAFLQPGGTTLLINLPTGEGKSLAFQCPAEAGRRRGQLTVVVTPTIALAQDHERRLKAGNWLDHNAAFHSGLSAIQREELIARIRNGSQWIVFTSPEALVGSLGYSILERARNGQVSQFVVDEAHLIHQWGLDFRPAFQFVAAFRDLLLRECLSPAKPRTLLLSATFTRECRDALEALFGRLDEVSALRLRPEIEYWHARADSTEARDALVVEASAHLPRPLIIYTSRRKDAERLFDILRSSGMRRVKLVRGGDLSADEEGARVLTAWSERNIDVVVATSAFGLGVDNDEVHAVIHACLPESVDRLYQEVGRGGRDGKASTSVMITAPGDLEIARKLGSYRRIGDEKGWARWQEMWLSRSAANGGAEDEYTVDFHVVPAHLAQESEENELWNLRTLILMARSEIIQLTILRPAIDDQEDVQAQFEAIFTRASFRLLNAPAATHEGLWEAAVRPERKRLDEGEQLSWSRLLELYDGTRAYHDVFKDAYLEGSTSEKITVPVGSCPVTRHTQEADHASFYPCASPFPISLDPPTLLRGADRMIVTYGPSAAEWGRAMRLLKRLVGVGFHEVSLPHTFHDAPEISRLHDWSELNFVVVSDCLSQSCGGPGFWAAYRLPLARISLLPTGKDLHALLPVLLNSRSPELIMLPSDTPSLNSPNWLFTEEYHAISINQLIRKLDHGTS